MTAAAYTIVGAVLAGCAAYAASVPPGSEHLTHLRCRRYARRMRGPLPAHDQGVPYDRRKWRAAMKSWHAPAAGQDAELTT